VFSLITDDKRVIENVIKKLFETFPDSDEVISEASFAMRRRCAAATLRPIP
jgi:hypothetical protein